MPYRLEVKYYNSFWLKKVKQEGGVTAPIPSIGSIDGQWPGLPWNPTFICSDGISRSYIDTCMFPFGYEGFSGEIKTSTPSNCNWVVEEARIKGGFNNPIVDLGVRAYAVNDIIEQVSRSSSLIFSGIYNTRTESNKTNVFSVGENIIKDADPYHGSIQRLHTEDSNLLVFQENKVHNLLVDKSTIYSGDQGAQEILGQPKVLGQLVPYLGEYGISKNPESFGVFGYRKYFADKNRSAILRLSRDGITEISAYGMRDYFRDYLSTISNDWRKTTLTKTIDSTPGTPSDTFNIQSQVNDIEIGSQVEIDSVAISSTVVSVVSSGGNAFTITLSNSEHDFGIGANLEATFVTYRRDKIPGGYDIHNQCYTMSMQTVPRIISTEADTFSTVSFDEAIKGWTSFYSYKPLFLGSLKNKFYSFIDGSIYEHYYQSPFNDSRCKFYGSTVPDDASITFIFNPDTSISKNFNTITYEGASGWEVDYFMSDFQGIDPDLPITSTPLYGSTNQYQDTINEVKSYDEGLYTVGGVNRRAGFDRKENKYMANIVNSSNVRPGEVIFGNQASGIKGFFATVKFSIDETTDPGGMKELYSVSSNYVMSSY